MRDTRRYLIVLELANYDQNRIIQIVPKLKKTLEDLSRDTPIEPAFRSVHADIFGFAIRSSLNAAQIHAAIESPQKHDAWRTGDLRDPFLMNGDHLMVLEIGEDFYTGAGFTRFGTWLQRK